MEKVYQIIEEEMKNRGVESQIANSGEDLTLRIMPENMGPDEDGVVITEVCRVPVEDEEYDYFQIYTTVAKEVGEEVYPRAMLKLNEINLSTLVGFFGILGSYGMVYHKHVAKIRTDSPEKMAKELFDMICDVYGVIDNDYADVFFAIR